MQSITEKWFTLQLYIIRGRKQPAWENQMNNFEQT